MRLYCVTATRFDTTIFPEAEVVRFYDKPLTPMQPDTVYRYTIIKPKRGASLDQDNAAMAELYEKTFKQSAPLSYRLREPVEYVLRERWENGRFVVDDEPSRWRRLRALAARTVYRFAPPVALDGNDGSQAVRVWKIQGLLTGAGVSHTCSGRLELKPDGDLVFDADPAELPGVLHGLPITDFRLQGHTDDGAPIHLDGCHLTRIGGAGDAHIGKDVMALSPRSAEIGAKPASNIDSCGFIVKNVSLIQRPFSWEYDGRRIEIRRAGPPTGAKLAKIVIAPKPADTPDDLLGIAQSLVQLMCVAHRSRSAIVLREYGQNGGSTWTETWPNDWPDKAPNPLLRSESFNDFLSQTLPRYHQTVESHRLFALVEYYVRTFIETTAEIKFIFASVFMEAFKFSWAANDTDPNVIPKRHADGFIKGFERPPTQAEIQKAQGRGKSADNKALTFEELLKKYASSIEASSGGFTFIENRNALFHSGLTTFAQTNPGTSAYPHLRTELEKLITQMEDILLEQLQYVGDIIPYGQPDDLVSFPGRQPQQP